MSAYGGIEGMRKVCNRCDELFISQEAYEVHMLRHEIKELIEVIKCIRSGIVVE